MPADEDHADPTEPPDPTEPQPGGIDPNATERAEETTPAPPETDVRPATESAGSGPASGSGSASGAGIDTLPAPSLPSPVKKTAAGAAAELSPGDQIDDFEVVETLGRGAFGVVYLARQLSLDRRVALKVTANRGSEGRTMARLEHAHIVQVFSETVDKTGRLRLLCMQLVPGASLEAAIKSLKLVSIRRGRWTGEDYLAAIDERSRVRESFDPAALRDREMLGEATDVETAAWVGARLAEAASFAHQNGVLHRDIKPANVLINQYGRPLLADFNISVGSAPTTGKADEESLGGTLAFMAPEHLAAFDLQSGARAEDVDERSDLYSLGIVVCELLTGRRPFNDPKRAGSQAAYVKRLAEHRSTTPPPIDSGPPTARKVLQHTVAKCLAPEKTARYQTGEELAAALDGCRRLAEFERRSPPAGGFVRSLIRHPIAGAVLLIFLPQLVGSVVNIAYNQNQIVGLLTPEQQSLFPRVVTWYNAVVYPIALAAMVYFFVPVFRVWQALSRAERIDPERVSAARRASIRLPLWVLTVAALGWLPGGIAFPWILNALAPPIDSHVYFHFFVSFAFSGLIAVAYSFCAMQYLVVRVLYPRMWTDATNFQSTARRELAGTGWRTHFMFYAALVVPNVANLVLGFSKAGEGGGLDLRLVTALVSALGLLGIPVVLVATQVMTKVKVALTGQS
ncbi:MAG: serine/threonine-protein kinase [Planctomycetota bacterium]